MQSRHADFTSPLSYAVMPQHCRVCPDLRRVRCMGHLRSSTKNKFAGRTRIVYGMRQRLRCLRLQAMTQNYGDDGKIDSIQSSSTSSSSNSSADVQVGQGDLLIHLSGQSNLELQVEGGLAQLDKQLDIPAMHTQTQTQTLPQLDQLQILNTQDAILSFSDAQATSDFESEKQQLEDNFSDPEQTSQFPDYLAQVDADPSSLQSQVQSLTEQNILTEQNPQSSVDEAQTLLTDLIEQNPEQNKNETQPILGLNLNNPEPLSQDFVQTPEKTDPSLPLGDSQLLSEFIDKDPTYVAPDYVEQLDSESTVQKQQVQEDVKLVKSSQQEDQKKQQQSQLARVISLAIPALGFVLADPLMSLVDTGCVGQTSAIQLAALGPNTAIFNLVFQVFQFLGATTSNILAQNSVQADGISEQQRKDRRNRGEQLMSYAMVSAGIFGIAVTLVLELFSQQLLTAVGASQQIMEPALAYLRIRALATPAVLISNVATGSCMGQQDSITPMLVFACSGVINLVLDMYLILNLSMGVTGAALATTVAQYIGMFFFIWYLRRKGQPQKQNSGKIQGIPLKWHGLPKLEELKPFQEVAQTLLLRTIFTMLAFTSVSVSASMLGTTSIAAHQVALQVFWFLSFVPEPLSVTAQSLIATDTTNVNKMRSMAVTILKMGCVVGAMLGCIMAGVFIGLPWLFTSDATIKAAIGPLTPAAVAAICSCSVVMMLDGISIGSNDSKHLRSTNFTALVVTLAMLGHGIYNGFTLQNVWWCLATFFQARLVLHLWHLMTHWKQTAFGRCEKDQTALVVAA